MPGSPPSTFSRLAGVTFRQLDHWSRLGYLGGQQMTPGSGHQRRLSADQLWRARLLAAGSKAGVKPGVLAAALDDGRRVRVEGDCVTVRLAAGVLLSIDVREISR